MRKTVNNVYVTGELITTEFIEEVSKFTEKLYRQLNVTVRYAPNLELNLTMKYNRENSKGEKSIMYDFVKEVFDKYKPRVKKVMGDRTPDGRPTWVEEVIGDTGDRVICKAELIPLERPYLSKKTNTIEMAINKMFKLNGKYGIAHAEEKNKDGANFNLEMIITSMSKNEDKDTMFINGFGVSQIGDNSSIYPLNLKVPANGIGVIEDQFDNYDLKSGVTATFRGNIIKGVEMVEGERNFDGESVLYPRNYDELRVMYEAKNIFEFDEDDDNNKGLNPKEISKLAKERNERNKQKKEEFESKLNFGKDKVDDEEDLPFKI